MSALAADDVADARIAFGTLVAYQKTDDIRALDLFTTNCLIVYKVIDEKSQTNMVAIPLEAFRAELKTEIEQKHGCKDEYRNVQFTSDGFTVTMTANVFSPESGKEVPFLIKYGRDRAGIMKIEELRTTVFSKPPAH
jgi:hypothetical protein